MRTSLVGSCRVLGLLALMLVAICGNAAAVDTGVRDTVRIVPANAGPSGAKVEVRFYNDQPLSGIELTLAYSSSSIHIDSVSFVGGRLASQSAKGWTTRTGGASAYFVAYQNLLPAGTGLFGTIYFGYAPTIPDQVVDITAAVITSSDTRYRTSFSDAASDPYSPQFVAGSLNIVTSGCCVGTRGNINGGADDVVDITDLTYMVNYMFKSGPVPPCFEEVDLVINGVIDIADLTYLINYMFKGGPALRSCY